MAGVVAWKHQMPGLAVIAAVVGQAAVVVADRKMWTAGLRTDLPVGTAVVDIALHAVSAAAASIVFASFAAEIF